MSGDSLGAMYRSAFWGDERARVLVPLVLTCLSWVYRRSDCDKALRKSVDTALLPLLVLCKCHVIESGTIDTDENV